MATLPFEQLVCSVQKDYTTVEVMFDGSTKRYTYKAPVGMLTEGDLALVPAVAGRLTIVEVVKVHRAPKMLTNANIRLQWVAQKIDLTDFNKRCEDEEALREQLEDMLVLDAQTKAQAMFAESLSGPAAEMYKQLKGN